MIIIYETINTVNGKTYIGQHHSHYENDTYLGSGKLIGKAIRKYGKKCFERKIIYRVMSQRLADFLEISTISERKAIGKAEYNLAPGGLGHSGTSWVKKGMKMSEEFKQKLRHPKSNTEKMGKGTLGTHRTDEWKSKMSEIMKAQYEKGDRLVSTAFLEKARTNAIGRKWYTNGKVDKMLYECPQGWHRGRSQMRNQLK